MRFPNGNKIHQDINESFGENVALIEQKLKAVDWWWFSFFYAGAFTALVVSLFILIVAVRFALIVI